MAKKEVVIAELDLFNEDGTQKETVSLKVLHDKINEIIKSLA